MNIEWWMIDGAVALIVLIAALRGAVKGIGDTVIKIICIIGGIALGFFFSDKLSAFLMRTRMSRTLYERFFVLLRGDAAVEAAPDAGGSMTGSIFASDGSAEDLISKSLGGIFSNAADRAADTAAQKLTEIAMGVIAFALIILAVSIVSMILRWIIRTARDSSIVIGFADRVLGMVLGGVRGLMLAWIAVALLIPVTTMVAADNVPVMLDALQQTTVARVLYDVNPFLVAIRYAFM